MLSLPRIWIEWASLAFFPLVILTYLMPQLGWVDFTAFSEFRMDVQLYMVLAGFTLLCGLAGLNLLVFNGSFHRKNIHYYLMHAFLGGNLIVAYMFWKASLDRDIGITILYAVRVMALAAYGIHYVRKQRKDLVDHLKLVMAVCLMMPTWWPLVQEWWFQLPLLLLFLYLLVWQLRQEGFILSRRASSNPLDQL